MTKKLIVSENAAKRIVQTGTPRKCVDRQIFRKPKRGTRTPLATTIDRHYFEYFDVGPGSSGVGSFVYCDALSADIFAQGFLTYSQHIEYYKRRVLRIGASESFDGIIESQSQGGVRVCYKEPSVVVSSYDRITGYGTAYSSYPIVLARIFCDYDAAIAGAQIKNPIFIDPDGCVAREHPFGAAGSLVALPSRSVFDDTGLALIALGAPTQEKGFIKAQVASVERDSNGYATSVDCVKGWGDVLDEYYVYNSCSVSYLTVGQRLRLSEGYNVLLHEFDDGYLIFLVAEDSGHQVGYVPSAVDATGTFNVFGLYNGQRSLVFENCTSPLSQPGDVFEPGQRVLIQKNQRTGNWEVINASCPSDENDEG